MITLTSEEAASAVLSIRHQSDGLTFALEREKGNIERGFLPYTTTQSKLDVVVSVQDLFFREEWLCFPFRKVQLYYTSETAILCPKELYQSESSSSWLHTLTSYLKTKTISTYAIEGEEKLLLTTIDTALLHFLQRTHITLCYEPAFLSFLQKTKQMARSSAQHQLLLYLELDSCYIFVLNSEGELIYINRFKVAIDTFSETTIGELVYYLASLWKQYDLEAETDCLHIIYSSDTTEVTLANLKNWVENLLEVVSSWCPNIETYPYSPLKS